MANEVRLIDANALSIRVMDASYWDNQDEDVIWNLVQDAPTVDAVEVVHGRWITTYKVDAWMGISKIDGYICSECGRGSIVKGNYCHNCGAKMDGERRTE